MTTLHSIQQTTALRALAATLAVATLVGVSACAPRSASRSGLFEPYRTDLPQGNYLTQAMVDQVKPGMTREQVKFALGAPLLTPVFRTDPPRPGEGGGTAAIATPPPSWVGLVARIRVSCRPRVKTSVLQPVPRSSRATPMSKR